MARSRKRSAGTRWLSIYGKAESNADALSFSGTTDGVPHGQQEPNALIRSDKLFDNGTIEFEFRLGAENSRLHVVLNDLTQQQIFVGPNLGNFSYAIALFSQPTNSWDYISQIGFGQRAPVGQWISAKIEVEGSLIRLFVAGVEACRGQWGITPSPLSVYFQGGEGEIRGLVINDLPAEAFVVMKFGGIYDVIFLEVIKPVCAEFGLKAVRGDEVYTNGPILNDITNSIRRASVVIADITPDNANVYYEVGFSHAISKPTILLCDKARERLPFDLSGFRTIMYENSIAGKPDVEERLRRHLSEQFRNIPQAT